MNHIFIVNPKAGKGRVQNIIDEINRACHKLKVSYSVYVSSNKDDCKVLIEELCSSEKELRIYGCGGDGTLNFIVNTVHKLIDRGKRQIPVEIGCVPVGSGNDFIRNFSRDFFDIEAQIKGKSMKCDLIRYREIDLEKYCVNMINIGFDSNVVEKVNKIRKNLLVAGKIAYILGIFASLIEKKGTNLKIEGDIENHTKGDIEIFHEGKLLMTSIGNGISFGGGIKGNPRARVDDGVMDLSIISNVSRKLFLKLFPKFKKGEHLNDKETMKVIKYLRGHTFKISPKENSMLIAIDGELMRTNTLHLEVMPGKMDFILP